jgi:histidinol-phosphate aminotransferase
MEQALDDDVSLVHITNPNNPTGSALETSALRAFCAKASNKAMVLVDEAYNELTDNPRTKHHDPSGKRGQGCGGRSNLF